MKKNKIPLKELQEIALWQQLNNQRIVLKHRQKPIHDESFKSLKDFCFHNQLFSTINDNPLFIEIPLSLITDFKDVFFITFYLRSWTAFIMGLIPDTYCLNVEKALADSFDSITKYCQRYEHCIDVQYDADNEDDVQLYSFIDEYLTEKESAGIDLPSLIRASHQLKLKAIKEIIKMDRKYYSTRIDDRLYIDIGKDKERDTINRIYKDTFCKKANPYRGGSFAKWNLQLIEVQKLLLNKRKETNLKNSIKKFINHELPLCKNEHELLLKFANDIKNVVDAGLKSQIAICDLRPFAFLKNPLPLV